MLCNINFIDIILKVFTMKNILSFIKRLIIIAIPIVLQQLFLNIASLLDTLMVGQLDESSVSGVYIATQIIFVVNLMMFGSIEGASVFFCQFFGKKDEINLKKSFAFKLYSSFLIGTIATVFILVFGRGLTSLFIKDPIAIEISVKYLNILTISFIPFSIIISITSSMRESHNTILPMTITLIGVIVNFIINYVFIFGKMGMPKLGAVGAAVGTTSERILELIILLIFCLKKKYTFCDNIFNNLKIEKKLFIQMVKKSIPLLINETLWALGQTVLVYIFSQSSDISTVVLPIATTIYNLIFVVCLGVGNAITILVANTVGTGEFEKAQKEANISLFFSGVVGVLLGIILILIAPFVTSLYTGVSSDAKHLAKILIDFYGIYIVLCALNNSLFFVLRAGGRTLLVFIFDSLYGWIIQIPFAFLLLNLFHLDFVPLVIIAYSIDIIKTIVGFILVFSKKWYRNLTIIN